MRRALALRHVGFEDLGSFASIAKARGYEVRYHDVGIDVLGPIGPSEAALVIVLGGPVGVYDAAAYPFLAEEVALLRSRLAAGRPTFGICLGAQLMAAALGAEVAPGVGKEIGFSPLTLTPAGEAGPLRHLAGVPVLHWHGDMFAIPSGAERLAATAICANQAFALGPQVMAVQFHPEVDLARGFEPWLIGHAVELAAAGLDPRALRADARRHARHLADAGCAMFEEWLDGLK